MPYTEISIEKGVIKIYEKQGKQSHAHPTLKVSDICKANGKAGVYVWGFYYPAIKTKNEKFHPLYVGKASNIYSRLINHLSHLRGGAYQMFDMRSIVSAKRNKIYEPKSLKDIVNYPDKCIQLPLILENFAFKYVITEDIKRSEEYVTKKVISELVQKGDYKKLSKHGIKDLLISGWLPSPKASNGGSVDVSNLNLPTDLDQGNDLDDMISDIWPQ